MPEWGFLPIPRKLLKMGIRDMVRISDARMSGTAFGTVVVHVTPESEKGGPLAAICTGDMIDIDVPGRRLDLMVDGQLVNQRLSNRKNTRSLTDRGYMWIYAKHVLQADKGCDFDFLRTL
jgi:dihydroxy-acid dehydratase